MLKRRVYCCLEQVVDTLHDNFQLVVVLLLHLYDAKLR